MHYDIIISGAGMAGMSLAIALKANNHSVAVIEKSIPTSDERTTALNHGTKLFFKEYKVWDLIEDESQSISDIFTVEGLSTSYLHYDHKILGDDPMGYVVKNCAIKAALDSFEVNKLSPITYTQIIDLGDKVEISLNDGQTITTDLFICAEGKQSSIYELFDIKRISREYKQSCIVCNVEHLEDHQGAAQERFYATGPFALLPMQGRFFSSLVWTAETVMAERLMESSSDEFIQAINRHCNFHVTKVISKIQTYPMSMTLSRRYYKGRILLMGDAMQSIHPVAGQGFNLIVRNIESLVLNLNKHGVTEEALRQFSHNRVIDNLFMAGVTHSLIKLFSNNSKVLKVIRSFGLSMIEELPFIKRRLIKYASGER